MSRTRPDPMHVGLRDGLRRRGARLRGLLAQVEARLGLVPRYRQRARRCRSGRVARSGSTTRASTCATRSARPACPVHGPTTSCGCWPAACSRTRLRRDRPLWEMWLVEGSPARGGPERFAIISKTHHAMVDGISGLDVLSAIFAPDEEARTGGGGHARSVRRRAAGRGAGRARAVAGELAAAGARRAAPPAPASPTTRRRARRGGSAGLGRPAAGAADALQPQPVGPDRRIAWYSVALDDVKAIKNELGGHGQRRRADDRRARAAPRPERRGEDIALG